MERGGRRARTTGRLECARRAFRQRLSLCSRRACVRHESRRVESASSLFRRRLLRRSRAAACALCTGRADPDELHLQISMNDSGFFACFDEC
eukprot:3556563-Pleurochrysis_carterae.AAC.3